MKTLQEALSKSMIKKLEKHEHVLTEFTKDDLENGDLLIDTSGNLVWMYLDADETNYRIKKFKEFSNLDNSVLQNHNGFIVCSSENDYFRDTYGLMIIPVSETKEKNNILVYNAKRFIKLIKCHKKYLNKNLTIDEIFYMNNYLKDYL